MADKQEFIDSKQEFIDIIEMVYRGARKGRGLGVSPMDYSTKYRHWLFWTQDNCLREEKAAATASQQHPTRTGSGKGAEKYKLSNTLAFLL